ncbi:MAG: NUDIX domain-containing protein [Bacteroidota bacterium]
MKDYVARIRSKIGTDLFIHPAARIIIENEKGEILFVRKTDRDRLALPAGGFEENEDIETCIKREVKEETGIELLQLEVIGISTRPAQEIVHYPNGDLIQYFTIEFYCNKFEGVLEVRDKAEIAEAMFMDKANLQFIPENEKSIIESWAYFQKHGKLMLK